VCPAVKIKKNIFMIFPAMKNQKAIVSLLVLIFLALFAAPYVGRAFWSFLILTELLNFESRGWLGYFSSSPRIREISYPGPLGSAKADLYHVHSDQKKSGILLNHGVIDTGKEDPRLRRFAEVLCRAGFVVFVPDLKGMRSFRISPGDIDEVEAAFEYFLSRAEISPKSCGLFGFSYGAGPTLIAASRPSIREKVRFVVSFGGYFDLKNVLSFLATGQCEFGGKSYSRQPQEYGKWVFLANNLDLIESPQDRAILGEILRIKLRDEKAPIDSFLAGLGEEGKNILNLLSHGNPSQTESFIRRLPQSVQSSMRALAVSAVLKNVQAELILAHGEDDDLIPFTETLRLAQAAPDPGKVYIEILKTHTHVDPEQRPWNLRNLLTFYVPEGWKLFRLVFELMRFR